MQVITKCCTADEHLDVDQKLLITLMIVRINPNLALAIFTLVLTIWRSGDSDSVGVFKLLGHLLVLFKRQP